jgi:hypothetical protein
VRLDGKYVNLERRARMERRMTPVKGVLRGNTTVVIEIIGRG